jgi:hypothetical protein
VVSTDCKGFRIFLSVIVIFICESIFRGNDRLQWIYTMFL